MKKAIYPFILVAGLLVFNFTWPALSEHVRDMLKQSESTHFIPVNFDLGINGQDIHNNTVLMDLASGGYERAAGILIELGADINHVNLYGETPLSIAAYRSLTSLLMELIRKGAHINSQNVHSDTPLQLAAMWGNEQAVQILLSRGACFPDKANDLVKANRRLFNEREAVKQGMFDLYCVPTDVSNLIEEFTDFTVKKSSRSPQSIRPSKKRRTK